MGLVWLLLSLPHLISASTELGCYASLPDGFTENNKYTYQSDSYCSNKCSGSNYKFFALFDGLTCYCGNSAPSITSDTNSANSCNVPCQGYPQNMCGGSGSYGVFAVANNYVISGASSANSEGSGGLTTSSSNSAAAFTSSTSTTTTSSTSSTSTSSTSSSTSSTASDGSPTDSMVTPTPLPLSTDTTSVEKTTIVRTVLNPGGSTEVVTVTSAVSGAATGGSTTAKSNSVVGPAVGGAVGGVAAIAIILLILYFVRRHHQNKLEREAEEEEIAYKKAFQPIPPNSVVPHLDNPFADEMMLKRDTSTARGTSSGYYEDNTDPSSTVNSYGDEQGVNRINSINHASEYDTHLDPRMNPVMLGRRRISEGSLADADDYSRKILGVSNPDDE
ncbi:hypothetical protein BABINDRAFT_161529 [Babjeviella inositovora NRRL Y-12698]|uniref:WSC domain-containing protein n=1 Tax=Babjeviella inositovora NRRL Y-12698 TaxID=984486 RepID=A0A1E3QQ74_9ASCO|nr:uncharacterized protein BABINDRAFT_161529 [Babjeviella inositovora NRRL Y-12698]ODQ79853.1 hypothetical protein BABINDRAFT_161529 [Babjeviella inositovora NRRL Y-12698]